MNFLTSEHSKTYNENFNNCVGFILTLKSKKINTFISIRGEAFLRSDLHNDICNNIGYVLCSFLKVSETVVIIFEHKPVVYFCGVIEKRFRDICRKCEEGFQTLIYV